MIPAPFVRIAMRYLSAELVAGGWLAEDQAAMIANDPDIVQVVAMIGGAIPAILTAGWYWLGRRLGWEK